jgi:hypothetical protein
MVLSYSENWNLIWCIGLPVISKFKSCVFCTPLTLGIKILSKIADSYIEDKDMVIKYLILGFTVIYVATVIVIYLKPDRSVWRFMIECAFQEHVRKLILED